MQVYMCIYFCSPALLNSNVFQVIYSKYTDLVPKEVMNVDDPELQRPDEEAIREVLYALMCLVSSGMLFVLQWDEMYTVVFFFFQITEKTRAALEKSVSQKVAAAMPVRAADKLAPAQYIRCVVLVFV